MAIAVKKKLAKRSVTPIQRVTRKRNVRKKEAPLTYKNVLELFRETREQMKETDKKIKELAGLFTTQWGKLVEALLGKGCLGIFKERGINVTQNGKELISRRGGETMEIDVLLVNGTEVVVIEVKTTATVSHVKELLDDLKEFKTFFPQYKSYKIYGGLAALKFVQESDRYAMAQGLFIVEPAGEGLVKIKNSTDFTPRAF